MKFAVRSLAAWGLLAAPAVRAINVNWNDPNSIKSACGVVAARLRSMYTGDRPGDVPGNLPQPYYWWEAGAMFGSFVDYWYFTGDEQYNAITTAAMVHQIGNNNAFMPDNQTRTLGNDDQAFWGITAMAAAEYNFPEAGGGAPSWLSLAQGVFNTQAPRWDNTTCSGGLRWQIFTFNNGYNYKNSISNGAFFNLAARLGKYTGNATYTQWAETAWDWMSQVGLMSPEFHYFDGTDVLQNCAAINHIEWSYNAGIFMLGAANMWNVTNDDKWRTRLNGIIGATDLFFENDVMKEQACEPSNLCNNDQRSFKAYLSRWMAATVKVAPFTYNALMPRLTASAQAAAAQCNGQPDGSTCGLRWTNNGVNDGSTGPGEQMAALEAMHSQLIGNVAGALSQNTGGTSKSDPNAGANANAQKPLNMDDITAGDKAGAGFLTTAILTGLIGGGYWMIS